MEILSDFPKIQCPFIRQTFPVNKDHFKQSGGRYNLRLPEVYLAVDRVNPGFEWVFAEGVVFYNLKRKAAGQVFMAKLRRDMFDWFYAGIDILEYDKKGRAEIEEQEKFD